MAGNSKTLVAAHPGNTNAVKSGIYSESGRVLAPRAQEIRDALMELDAWLDAYREGPAV